MLRTKPMVYPWGSAHPTLPSGLRLTSVAPTEMVFLVLLGFFMLLWTVPFPQWGNEAAPL